MWLKLLNILGFSLFALFAFLQLNDTAQYGNHDPWIWVALYAFAALLNLSVLLFAVPAQVFWVWLGFVAGSLLFKVQDDQGNLHLDWLNPSAYWNETGTQMVQQNNEAGGLLVLLIWAILHLILNRKKRVNSWH